MIRDTAEMQPRMDLSKLRGLVNKVPPPTENEKAAARHAAVAAAAAAFGLELEDVTAEKKPARRRRERLAHLRSAHLSRLVLGCIDSN